MLHMAKVYAHGFKLPGKVKDVRPDKLHAWIILDDKKISSGRWPTLVRLACGMCREKGEWIEDRQVVRCPECKEIGI